MPLLALHRRFVLGNDKMATAPDLSLRGRSAPVAISGRHSQPVQAAVKMEKAEIWGVAAVSDRLWQLQIWRYFRRMCKAPKLVIARRPKADVAP